MPNESTVHITLKDDVELPEDIQQSLAANQHEARKGLLSRAAKVLEVAFPQGAHATRETGVKNGTELRVVVFLPIQEFRSRIEALGFSLVENPPKDDEPEAETRE